METLLFNILDRVDSTNNYAMARVHEGLAIHGQAWFAHCQEKGKGQRGKAWESNAGDNLILSIAVQPPKDYEVSRFHFQALIALAASAFLESVSGKKFLIKWPNDLYYGDRKTGGILIENTLQGSEWKWAVLGFGINLNQVSFPASVPNAGSLCGITGRTYDTVLLARQLHSAIINAVDNAPGISGFSVLLENFNRKLYGRGRLVRLRSGNRVFEAKIKEVDEYGRLAIADSLNSAFNHGEVEWLGLC